MIRRTGKNSKQNKAADTRSSISGLGSGSHKPPTYLGHRYGIDEHKSPNHYLSLALTAGLPPKWTEFNFAGKPAVVGDKNILCEHHLRTQSTPVERFDLYFQVGWLKLLQFDFYSRKFGCVGDPSQMHWSPTGKDRRPLSVTTGHCVAGKSAGYENQALTSDQTNFSAIIYFLS